MSAYGFLALDRYFGNFRCFGNFDYALLKQWLLGLVETEQILRGGVVKTDRPSESAETLFAVAKGSCHQF